jgi:hypothetical protein
MIVPSRGVSTPRPGSGGALFQWGAAGPGDAATLEDTSLENRRSAVAWVDPEPDIMARKNSSDVQAIIAQLSALDLEGVVAFVEVLRDATRTMEVSRIPEGREALLNVLATSLVRNMLNEETAREPLQFFVSWLQLAFLGDHRTLAGHIRAAASSSQKELKHRAKPPKSKRHPPELADEMRRLLKAMKPHDVACRLNNSGWRTTCGTIWNSGSVRKYLSRHPLATPIT